MPTPNLVSGCCASRCRIRWPHYPEPGCASWPMEPAYARAPVLWPGFDATIRPPYPQNPALGSTAWAGWHPDAHATWSWDRQPPEWLPPARTAPWIWPGTWVPPYHGRLGQAPEEYSWAGYEREMSSLPEEAQRLASQLLDLAVGRRFARMMVDLQAVVSDWRDARDAWLRVPSADAGVGAFNAEQNRLRALGLYDRLAEVYRVLPDIGLSGPGALGVAPQALAMVILSVAAAVAAVLGGLSLYGWINTQRAQAEANGRLARAAEQVCAAYPGSPQCQQALDAANRGVPPPGGGPEALLGQIGKIVAWGAVALIGWKALEAIGTAMGRRKAAATA